MDPIINVPIPLNNRPFPYMLYAFELDTPSNTKKRKNIAQHFVLLNHLHEFLQEVGISSYASLALWVKQEELPGNVANLTPKLKDMLLQANLIDSRANMQTVIVDMVRSVGGGATACLHTRTRS